MHPTHAEHEPRPLLCGAPRRTGFGLPPFLLEARRARDAGGWNDKSFIDRIGWMKQHSVQSTRGSRPHWGTLSDQPAAADQRNDSDMGAAVMRWREPVLPQVDGGALPCKLDGSSANDFRGGPNSS
ncbi:hypothetical protein [Roseateles sp.]|uniref:hypothetical protein n=1 Tax=Roseateles sp. TaxID=1971397 RepID=UPI0025EE8759|nr:hypothetical protein [Roseateles sp.]MBV8035129.1 hypothetical protein [Roseateles sp.]